MPVVHACRTCNKPVVEKRRWYCSQECYRESRRKFDHDRRPTACSGCGSEKPRIRGRKLCDDCRDKRKPVWERESANRKAVRARERRIDSGKRVMAPKIIPDGMRWCARCQQLLSRTEFNSKKGRGYCIDCTATYNLEYRLKTQYNMSLDQYYELFQFQEQRCAICRNRPRSRMMAVDHDHKTGEVRGLLCTSCNHRVLGGAHDDIGILRRAVEYLELSPNKRLAFVNSLLEDSTPDDTVVEERS